MRGNPIVRLAFLVLLLAGAGLLVHMITRPAVLAATNSPPLGLRDTSPRSSEADLEVEAYLEFRLSSPARSITLGASGAPPWAFEVQPEGLEGDLDFSLALRGGLPIKDTLHVDWVNPAQSNFLHLKIEPETLETRELTLHFPPEEHTAVLDFSWPDERTTP